MTINLEANTLYLSPKITKSQIRSALSEVSLKEFKKLMTDLRLIQLQLDPRKIKTSYKAWSLIDQAYAGSGKKCLYGGYYSLTSNDLCMHPLRLSSSNKYRKKYIESCKKIKITPGNKPPTKCYDDNYNYCNPLLFGYQRLPIKSPNAGANYAQTTSANCFQNTVNLEKNDELFFDKIQEQSISEDLFDLYDDSIRMCLCEDSQIDEEYANRVKGSSTCLSLLSRISKILEGVHACLDEDSKFLSLIESLINTHNFDKIWKDNKSSMTERLDKYNASYINNFDYFDTELLQGFCKPNEIILEKKIQPIIITAKKNDKQEKKEEKRDEKKDETSCFIIELDKSCTQTECTITINAKNECANEGIKLKYFIGNDEKILPSLDDLPLELNVERKDEEYAVIAQTIGKDNQIEKEITIPALGADEDSSLSCLDSDFSLEIKNSCDQNRSPNIENCEVTLASLFDCEGHEHEVAKEDIVWSLDESLSHVKSLKTNTKGSITLDSTKSFKRSYGNYDVSLSGTITYKITSKDETKEKGLEGIKTIDIDQSVSIPMINRTTITPPSQMNVDPSNDKL